MPRRFKRFRRATRRTGRKTGFFNKKYSISQMASSALRGVSYLRGLVNSEMLKLDTAFTGGVGGGSLTSIVPLTQNDSASGRTGNSVFVRSVNWKGSVSRTTAGNAVQVIRFGVLMDTQQLGDTTPSYTDVFSADNPYCHLNASTVGRYKILSTKTVILDTVQKLGIPFEINLPMKHHIRFNGTASSDIQKGGLYIYACSDQASANYPTFASEARLSYHDN